MLHQGAVLTAPCLTALKTAPIPVGESIRMHLPKELLQVPAPLAVDPAALEIIELPPRQLSQPSQLLLLPAASIVTLPAVRHEKQEDPAPSGRGGGDDSDRGSGGRRQRAAAAAASQPEFSSSQPARISRPASQNWILGQPAAHKHGSKQVLEAAVGMAKAEGPAGGTMADHMYTEGRQGKSCKRG